MKMTLTNLKDFVKAYVLQTLQGNPTYTPSYEDISGMINKLGKQVEIKGLFNDKLQMLDADFLELGKTIEEYFINLTLPQNFDSNGANDLAPKYPTKGEVYYSYDLGRKVIATTVPYGRIESACINAETFADYIASIMEKLYNSQDMYKYGIKKQLLGNVIKKADTKGRTTTLALPTDTTTAEDFILNIKQLVSNSNFANDNNSLGDEMIGATPRLTLFIKKGILPVLEVKALAGAFNIDKLKMECDIVEVDDFGDADAKYYALLADARGIKLHPSYLAMREKQNAEGDFINYYLHSDFTAFISNYVFVNAIKSAA